MPVPDPFGQVGAIDAVLRIFAVAIACIVRDQVDVARRNAGRFELADGALGVAVIIEQGDDRVGCHCLLLLSFSSTTLPRKSRPTRTRRPSFIASACQIEFWSLCSWSDIGVAAIFDPAARLPFGEAVGARLQPGICRSAVAIAALGLTERAGRRGRGIRRVARGRARRGALRERQT